MNLEPYEIPHCVLSEYKWEYDARNDYVIHAIIESPNT